MNVWPWAKIHFQTAKILKKRTSIDILGAMQSDYLKSTNTLHFTMAFSFRMVFILSLSLSASFSVIRYVFANAHPLNKYAQRWRMFANQQ